MFMSGDRKNGNFITFALRHDRAIEEGQTDKAKATKKWMAFILRSPLESASLDWISLGGGGLFQKWKAGKAALILLRRKKVYRNKDEAFDPSVNMIKKAKDKGQHWKPERKKLYLSQEIDLFVICREPSS